MKVYVYRDNTDGKMKVFHTEAAAVKHAVSEFYSDRFNTEYNFIDAVIDGEISVEECKIEED